MAFLRKRSLSGGNSGKFVNVIIDNSDVITIGECVQTRNGNLEISTAAAAIFGVVVDIVDKNGNSIFGSLAVLGSATKTGSAFSGAVTVASNNETVDLIAAKVDCSMDTVYSAGVSGTINTTVASNKLGCWLDLASGALLVDETTATRTITTGGQFVSWGADPDDTTRMLVSIHESEAFSFGAATA